jgi:Transposase DDE domain group 1
MNSAWLATSLIAAGLLSWLRLIALDGDLARAEPKTLRYRVLHAAGKLVRGGRRRRLKIPVTWPWAQAIATAWARVTALPHPP